MVDSPEIFPHNRKFYVPFFMAAIRLVFPKAQKAQKSIQENAVPENTHLLCKGKVPRFLIGPPNMLSIHFTECCMPKESCHLAINTFNVI